MPKCNNCGSHLTEKYVQVFGNRHNEVENCLHCVDGSRVDEREMAGLEGTGTW